MKLLTPIICSIVPFESHAAHLAGGGSFIFWISSTTCPHLRHL